METIQGVPGIKTSRTATPRRVVWSADGLQVLPAGKVLNGALSRDPLNTGDVDVLRAGILLGKITASGKYAPSVIGPSGEAMDGDETEMDVSVATATEIIRRIGASGTFKLTGPATAAGTVRTVTVTFSNCVAATGKITMTAMGTAEVQTLTEAAGTDGGTFRVRYRGYSDGIDVTTTDLAWDISTANLQTALRALHADLAAVVVTGTPGTDYTLTFPQKGATAGPKNLVAIVNDSTADGGVMEGGILVARTATGVNGDFVTASLIQPTDGSETPKGVLGDGYGLKATDEDKADIDQQLADLVVSGMIDASQIVNYPADASLKAWVKAQLRNNGGRWMFDDEF